MAMALQQGHRPEEHIDLVQDIKMHWKQPKVVLSRLQTWTTQQPIAVEALMATLAGSVQVLTLPLSSHTILSTTIIGHHNKLAARSVQISTL